MKALRLRGETTFAVWSRRAISVPLIMTTFCIGWAASPVLLILALVSDLVDLKRLPRTRALLFFLLYLSCETIGIVASLWVWLRAVVSKRAAGEFEETNFALQRWFTGSIFRGAVRIFSIKVEQTGEPGEGPVLVMMRHASTADTVIAGALVATVNGPRLRYVLKRELLWDPCLDIVGRRLPNVFADRSGSRSDAEIAAVRNLAQVLSARDGVLIYPEGTRFSESQRVRALEKLRERNDGLYELASKFTHVLPPKLGGPMALLEALPTVDVLFLEHQGFEGARSFGEFFRGGLVHATLRIRMRRVPAPSGTAAGGDLAQWLFAQWANVNAWVANA